MLYWDFLMRHEPLFENHPRLGQQVRNLRRLSEADRAAIRRQAARIRYNFVTTEPYLLHQTPAFREKTWGQPDKQ
jgi:deoxyribodipyrimidine photolyase-like uncharacterized protein